MLIVRSIGLSIKLIPGKWLWHGVPQPLDVLGRSNLFRQTCTQMNIVNLRYIFDLIHR